MDGFELHLHKILVSILFQCVDTFAEFYYISLVLAMQGSHMARRGCCKAHGLEICQCRIVSR